MLQWKFASAPSDWGDDGNCASVLGKRAPAAPTAANTGSLPEIRPPSLLAGEAGSAYAYVRAGVADRLRQASGALPDGLQFLIFEGHRPVALQRRYFERRLDKLRAAEPASDPARLYMLASQYVSPPEIAPHSSSPGIRHSARRPGGIVRSSVKRYVRPELSTTQPNGGTGRTATGTGP